MSIYVVGLDIAHFVYYTLTFLNLKTWPFGRPLFCLVFLRIHSYTVHAFLWLTLSFHLEWTIHFLFPSQLLASIASCTSGASILQRYLRESPTMTWVSNSPLTPNWRTTWPTWCLNLKVQANAWMPLIFCAFLFSSCDFNFVSPWTMKQRNLI